MPHSSPHSSGAVPALVVVSRFRVEGHERTRFLDDAARAMDALGAQSGCVALSLAQSTDDAELLLLRSEWSGVGAYRRALSAFDVKVNAVPLLSCAIDEPSAYEVIRDGAGAGATVTASGLAADAGSVSLGSASGPHVPPVTS